MANETTGRESDKFMLRLPDGMRDRLKAAAEENNRSMNAEIVARLERSFEDAPTQGVAMDVVETIVRKAVATSLYHVTHSIVALAEAGKHNEERGKPSNYVGMIREIADEFKERYEHEVGSDTEEKN